MRQCYECGLPLARCICLDPAIPCTLCGEMGCEGECIEDELDEVEPLDFSHSEDD